MIRSRSHYGGDGNDAAFWDWCGGGPLHPRPAPLAEPFAAEVHWVKRTKLGAAEDAETQTLLFLHGVPSSLFTWAEVIVPKNVLAPTDLAVEFDLVAVDLPGHGFTETLKHPEQTMLEPDRAAEFVLRFMRRTGVQRAVVVGHGYGAIVASYVAAFAPERVDGLVLMDAEGVPREDGEMAVSELSQRSAPAHWLVRWFGWMARPGSTFRNGSIWEGIAEDGLRDRSTRDLYLPRGSDRRIRDAASNPRELRLSPHVGIAE